jgi:Spy/CpxP family protein refolding chaperone
LRFLAYKLGLDEAQVTELAAILHELKTERAQAEVDSRRTTSALADAVAAEPFDEAKAQAAAGERVKSAERVQAAVSRALGRIHALLRSEQRAKLAARPAGEPSRPEPGLIVPDRPAPGREGRTVP